MNILEDRLIICGVDDVPDYNLYRITHMLSVANPGAEIHRPMWFSGEYLELYFGDVDSESDAAQWGTKAPVDADVRHAVDFIVHAWRINTSRVLVHCDYGASRSPALAYVALAKKLGPGHEGKTLQVILNIQPSAVPNKLVVQLGDELLERHGALLKPLNKLYSKISKELLLK
jgi:predicted protein tyrosine phosphatase